MFTRSHLQEMKRRYASMYAPPVEEKVIEDGTIEGVNQYKKDTPGQDIEKEFKEHCGVCGEQGIEEDEIDESLALQLKMAFDDAKIKMKSKKGKIVIAKKDKKKATDVLTKTLPSKLKKYVDKAIDNFIVFEEVEIDEAVDPAYPPTIKNLRMIVKDKQHQKFMFDKGQAIVDTFTASAMIAVYDAMKKPEIKKKFEEMIKSKEGFMKTQAFAMKMIK